MNWIRKKSDQTLSSCNHFLSGHRKTGIHLKFREIVRYQRDGALVGAFGSHHYDPVSNSRGDDIRKFSFGSNPCSKRFFTGYSGFSLCSKTIIAKFLILSGSVMVNKFEPLCECATPKSLYTNYKLICKPHGSLSTFLNPIQTGFFSQLSVTGTRELRSPPRLSKKSFV